MKRNEYRHGGRKSYAMKALAAAVASLFAGAAGAQALPTGGSVATGNGTATINQSGAAMTIQTSQRAIIDWTTFNIGSGTSVTFQQPGATSVAVNRVSAGGGSSEIAGALNANGHVMLLNPNGIAFTSTASVNVGGLIASTGKINDSDFMSSSTAPIAITGATGGTISNQGTITVGTVTSAGLAAFVAPSVSNSGTITATKGHIALASAQAATISLNGGLYEIAVDQAAPNGSVGNMVTGTLNATGSGGTITLSAGDAANLISGVINLEGVQQANAIVVNGNTVELSSSLQAPSVSGNSAIVNVHPGGGRIQDGVNVAKSGGTVNVDAGTYAENVSITKALTLDGAGAGRSIIAPAGGTAVDISGNIGADAGVTIDGFTFKNAPLYGVRIDGATTLGRLTVQNSDFTGMGKDGFFIDGVSSGHANAGAPGLANVALISDTFEANGLPYTDPNITSLGYGDVLINYYNGNLTLNNVHITGNGEFIGVQMRGASPTLDLPQNAGTVVFDDVTIDGSFYRPANSRGTFNPGGPGDAIHLLEYASVANVSFNHVKINTDVGHGMFLEGLGSTLDIGNTTFGVPDTTVTGGGRTPTRSWNIVSGSNSNNLLTNVDATSSSFTGATDGFAIEDRVFHAVDATGLGLVTWNPGNLYVTPSSGSIQRGIDAASAGNTVNVAAGTYAEQLTVTKSLSLVGAGSNNTIIAPTSLASATYTSLDGPLSMKNILTIGGGPTTNAEVSGFTFKGPVPGITSGIFVRDGAHADIHDNKVIDIRDNAVLSGVQSGIGVFVGRAYIGTFGMAVIENNIITGYQKGGIVVDGPGSQASVTGNTVTGEGPTPVTAQNGIQISRGASATVTGNTVSGNAYTGIHQSLDDEAAGILIFTSGSTLGQGGITVGPNTITGNEAGVWTNDPNTLATIGLAGVSGNTHNAVASFTGGYAGQGNLLEYPAWSASNTALVNAATFTGTQSGDIVDAGGALRVSGWSGFAAIQPAIDAVAAGGTVNVAAGTYAESVTVNGLRNLSFDGATIHGLTLNSGARGSGIGGSVTADAAAGFTFNASVVLLGDTMLSTNGGNIALNGDIQNAGATRHGLSLMSGSGTTLGDVTLVSGGTQTNPLGSFDLSSNNFTLSGTLWVAGYSIDSLGNVALSGHTLHAVDSGVTNTINAGGNVTGSTISNGSVIVSAGGPVNLGGSAPSLDINAPAGGSITGSFGQVNNTGSSVITVNGTPQAPATVSASANSSQLIPPAALIVDNTAAGTGAAAGSPDGSFAKSLPAGSESAAGQGGAAPVVRGSPASAGDLILQGRSVEIDLSPANDREKNP